MAAEQRLLTWLIWLVSAMSRQTLATLSAADCIVLMQFCRWAGESWDQGAVSGARVLFAGVVVLVVSVVGELLSV